MKCPTVLQPAGQKAAILMFVSSNTALKILLCPNAAIKTVDFKLLSTVGMLLTQGIPQQRPFS